MTLAVAITLLMPTPVSAHRTVPAGFFGVNWDQEIAFKAPVSLQGSQFGRMAAAGVESVRASFLWSTAQPAPGGPIEFSATDATVSMASAHGRYCRS